MSFNILFAQNNFKKQHNIRWVKNDFSQNSINNLNNFSPLLLGTSIKESFLKTSFSRTNSIYIVYKTSSTKGEQLLSLYGNEKSHNFNSHFLIKNDSIDLKKGNKKKGIILSYTFNQKKKKEAFITLNNQYLDSTTSVYEMIFIDQKLTKIEKSGIETYLALKYGISLANSTYYKNHIGEDLWNSKKNESFNYKLFGIGKSNYYSFFNNESSHSEEAFLKIQMDTLFVKNRMDAVGRKKVYDDDFLIIGSNQGRVSFEENENSQMKILSKRWMIQNYGKQVKKAFIKVNWKELNIDTLDVENLVLLVNKEKPEFNENSDFIVFKGEINKDELIFECKEWDGDKSGCDYFTLSINRILSLDAIWDNKDVCFTQNQIKIKIKDGISPYMLAITNLKTRNIDYLKVDQDEVEFNALSNDSHNVQVTDASGLKKNLLVESANNSVQNNNITIVLNDVFNIQDNFALIKPIVNNPNNVKLSYTWTKSGNILAKTQTIKATEEGVYTLDVENELGCSQQYLTKVNKISSDYLNEDWKIYPNPCRTTDFFSIHFNFIKPTHVQYYIYTLDGKLIASKDLGNITNETIKEKIHFPGTYQILATYNNSSQIKKIIIH